MCSARETLPLGCVFGCHLCGSNLLRAEQNLPLPCHFLDDLFFAALMCKAVCRFFTGSIPVIWATEKQYLDNGVWFGLVVRQALMYPKLTSLGSPHHQLVSTSPMLPLLGVCHHAGFCGAGAQTLGLVHAPSDFCCLTYIPSL